jgi:RNA polymerase primary sigma factor
VIMHNTAEVLEEEFQDDGRPTVETEFDSSDEIDGKGQVEDRDRDESFQDGPRDLVAAFFADVSQVDLLTRDEEEALGGRIALHRARILNLLRRRPRLVAEALAGAGRGVVRPEEDFREREALMVLTYVRRRLSVMPRRVRGRKTLVKFADDLGKELTRYRSLRDRMMTANVRLVMTLARRYHHPTLSYLDLVQEGVLGLMRAVEKYEPARGIKFSTYAVWWIWQQISRAADCQGAMIRTPVHWNQMRRKLGRVTSPTEGDEDRTDLVAEEHGVSPERIALMAQSFHCVSLAAPLGEGDERTVADTLAAEDESNPERVVAGAKLSERVASAVGELPDREAQILRLRFGLNGGQTYTLEEIGERFGVSRERIRQLEARALKQMKVICDAQGLADALQ